MYNVQQLQLFNISLQNKSDQHILFQIFCIKVNSSLIYKQTNPFYMILVNPNRNSVMLPLM